MKKKNKILLALIVGFALGILLMVIAIYFGFTKAYRTNENELTVTILAIPIYEITKSGTNYVGKAIGNHMGLICGICMVLSLIVEEFFSKVKHK